MRQLACLCLGSAAAITTVFAQTLNIEGVDNELERNIRGHIGDPGWGCSDSELSLRRQLPSLRRSTIRAAQALGYYDSTIEQSLLREDDCWTVQLRIEPGEPTRLEAINLLGEGDSLLDQNWLQSQGLTPGAVLRHDRYESVKNELVRRAIDGGYLDAQLLQHEIRLSPSAKSAAIDLDLQLGRRYQLGVYEFPELEALSADFIERLAETPENAVYSPANIIGLRNRLLNSQYFDSVRIQPRLNSRADGTVPLDISLTPVQKHVMSTGAGFATDIGPRVRFDYGNNYLNRSGHRFNTELRASPIEQSADISYAVPLARPSEESLRFDLGFQREEPDSFTSETAKLGMRWLFLNRLDWRQSVFTSYQRDKFQLIDQPEQSTELTLFGSSITHTESDDEVLPTSGWRGLVRLRGASDMLLSDADMLQLDANFKLVQSIGSLRLLSRLDWGSTWTTDKSALPVSVLYFAGGDQSVRGYAYQSLGELSESDDLVPGRHLIAASVELELPVAENWRLALFSDGGSAFDDYGDFELQKSVGVGVRWISPLGPIRLDLARALDGDEDFRLHISMGPDL